jgi:lipopolysaccharide biosynthesis glycosyltransferase
MVKAYQKKKVNTIVTGHNTGYVYPWMLMARCCALNTTGNFKMIAANMNSSMDTKDIRFMTEYAKYLEIDLEILDLSLPKDLVKQLGNMAIGYISLLFLDALDEDFVWLDSDLILKPGWERIFDLGDDKELGGKKIKYPVIRAAKDREATVNQHKFKNTNGAYLKNPQNYFNCGVMWLSPSNWKKFKLDQTWQDVVRRESELGLEFIDQDILNYLLHDKVEIMSKRLNYITGDYYVKDPLITHFAGYPKPWVLSPKAKAMYFMREALNADRPRFRPSREGKFKTEYLEYWRLEAEMLDDLKLNRSDLYEEAVARKKSVTKDLNLQERIKFNIARALSVEFGNVLTRNTPVLTETQNPLWEDRV